MQLAVFAAEETKKRRRGRRGRRPFLVRPLKEAKHVVPRRCQAESREGAEDDNGVPAPPVNGARGSSPRPGNPDAKDGEPSAGQEVTREYANRVGIR